jgi:hypothetical protein
MTKHKCGCCIEAGLSCSVRMLSYRAVAGLDARQLPFRTTLMYMPDRRMPCGPSLTT